MRIDWFVPIIAAVGIAVVWIGNVAAQNTPEGTIKIGMVMPMTGTLASAGKQVVAGARLYMRHHGDMVAGKRVELIVRDDTSAFEVGKRLIQERRIDGRLARQRSADNRGWQAHRGHAGEHVGLDREVSLFR